MTTRSRTRWIAASFGLAALAAAGIARADDRCEARVADWQPRSAVVRMAEAKGWQVESIRVDDGCYEIRASDGQGKRLRAKVDPSTLEVVKLKTRGDDEGHGRRWRGGEEDERGEGRGERRRRHRGGDDEGRGRDRGGQDGGQASGPDGATPPPAPPFAQAPAPQGGLIGKPKAVIR